VIDFGMVTNFLADDSKVLDQHGDPLPHPYSPAVMNLEIDRSKRKAQRPLFPSQVNIMEVIFPLHLLWNSPEKTSKENHSGCLKKL